MQMKIKQNTIVEQVLKSIKELIADGTFAVGEKIPTESEMTEMFGVGRSSVREALKILQYLGVVEIYPSKGTYVADCSKLSKEVVNFAILLRKRDFFELIELRKAIEMASLRSFLTSEKTDTTKWNKELSTLETCYQQMLRSASIDVFVQEDYKFHEAIISGSGNSIYIDIYHTLHAFMHEEIKRALEGESCLDDIHREHFAILQMIKERRPNDALDELNNHLEHVQDRVRKTFKEGLA